jgi:4-diphosphocytidyl-2-C-methyl-D-erythritol kinase
VKADRRALLAPAKINLYLHVLGKRGDGLHALDSLVGFVELADRIGVRRARGISLAANGPFATELPAPAENIAVRAAELLRGAAGVDVGARISIEKNLPVAAGIGGGSADAAAVLRALNALWGLGFDLPHLAKIGAALGADVPVCLAGRVAYIAGAGERVRPAAGLPAAPILLLNPGVKLPTREVFALVRGPFAPRSGEPVWQGGGIAGLARALAAGRNDLTAPALALVPAIGAALQSLARRPGCLVARMSGSGATCFGLFASAQALRAAAAEIKLEQPGWWVAETRLLG